MWLGHFFKSPFTDLPDTDSHDIWFLVPNTQTFESLYIIFKSIHLHPRHGTNDRAGPSMCSKYSLSSITDLRFSRQRREITWRTWKKSHKRVGSLKSSSRSMLHQQATSLAFPRNRSSKNTPNGSETFPIPIWTVVYIWAMLLPSRKSSSRRVTSGCWAKGFCFLMDSTLQECLSRCARNSSFYAFFKSLCPLGVFR